MQENQDNCEQYNSDNNNEDISNRLKDLVISPSSRQQVEDADQQIKRIVRSSVSGTILCDCGYGWPKQKRPRSERIRAVSRQICNFLEGVGNSNANKTTKCRLIVTSENKEDIHPLENRISQTLKEGEILFDDKLLDFREDALTSLLDVTSTVDDDIVYLSPDAKDVLDPSLPPPKIIAVGMLVDRRVTPGRSRARAEGLGTKKIKVARLPLHVTNLEGLDDNEPLNIDTVMEIFQLWWHNYNNKINQRKYGDSSKKYGSACASETEETNAEKEQEGNKCCFVNAAIEAMLNHQERHPNRTLHK